jgi:hypothetical protein
MIPASLFESASGMTFRSQYASGLAATIERLTIAGGGLARLVRKDGLMSDIVPSEKSDDAFDFDLVPSKDRDSTRTIPWDFYCDVKNIAAMKASFA